MGAKFLLGIVGLSSGTIVAGGVVALMVGLNIITRYAGLTKTASRVRIYESCMLVGSIYGNLLSVHNLLIPVGKVGLMIQGAFSGIFVGSWIMALAEIVNLFPVFSRRIGLVKGMSVIVISIAIGKVTGSMLHFYMGW